ncbi:C39 family peptidase [Myxococcota bacterium]|nr:C39 family peptidase [Myxococcota bacterium]
MVAPVSVRTDRSVRFADDELRAPSRTARATSSTTNVTTNVTTGAGSASAQGSTPVSSVNDASRAFGRARMTSDPLAQQLRMRAHGALGVSPQPMIDPGSGGTPATGGGLPTTAADAERLWLPQNGGTLGRPSAAVNLNCGPTSLATTLRATGQMPPGLTDQEQIQYARALMTGLPSQLSMIPGTNYPTTSYRGGVTYKSIDVNGDGTPERIPLLDAPRVALSNTTLQNVTRFLAAQNGDATGGDLERGWDALDDALEAGKPVVADGNLSATWSASFDPASRAPQINSGAHFISILGKNGDRYIVSDPMSGGPVEMTRDQLAAFFARYDGVPRFAAVSP